MSKGIYWKCLRCDFGHIEDECPNCGWHTRGEFDLPPQRTWVGLDHHDKKKFSSWLDDKTDDEVFTAIETKLKELNT